LVNNKDIECSAVQKKIVAFETKRSHGTVLVIGFSKTFDSIWDLVPYQQSCFMHRTCFFLLHRKAQIHCTSDQRNPVATSTVL